MNYQAVKCVTLAVAASLSVGSQASATATQDHTPHTGTYVVTLQPSKVLSRKMMPVAQSMNMASIKPTVPLLEGTCVVDGRAYKVYKPKGWTFDLDKPANFDNVAITQETGGIYVDYNGDGDLSTTERWFPFKPIRFGSVMLKVDSMSEKQIVFSEVEGPPRGMIEGFSAPDFEYIDADGNLQTLEKYRGKYLLLDVFSITCHNCIEEWPTLLKIQKKLGEDKMGVVLLSTDNSNRSFLPHVAKLNKTIAASKGMPWGNVLIPGGWDEMVDRFNTYGYGLYLIDPNGKVLMARDRAPRLEQILNVKVE